MHPGGIAEQVFLNKEKRTKSGFAFWTRISHGMAMAAKNRTPKGEKREGIPPSV